MSLINKMLRDIESRQEQTAPRPIPVKPVYQDLRAAVPAPRAARGAPRLLLVAGGSIVAVLALGYYAWDRDWVRTAPASRAVAVAPPQAPKRAAPVPSPLTTSSAPVPMAPVSTPAPSVPPVVVAKTVTPAVGVSEPKTSVAAVAAMDDVESALPASGAPAPTAVPPMKPASKPAVIAKRENVGPTVAAPSTPGSIDKRMRPLTSEEKAESAYRQAARSLEQGRSGDAGRMLRQALAADPQHVHARELLVTLALKNGRNREAQQLLEEGMVLAPKHYPFVQLLARLHVENGAELRALALLEQAAPNAANDADYQGLLAALYQRQGRHADAVATYRQALELRPTDSRAWVGLGISLEAEKDYGAARLSYQRARGLGDLPPALARHTDQRLAQLRATN